MHNSTNKLKIKPLLLFCRVKYFIHLLPFILLQSCDLFEAHPFDGKVTGETDINNKNIKLIEAGCADKTTIRFAMTGDTQSWYSETEDFVKTINARHDIDFVIHGGDVTDFGLTNEFVWQRDILNKLKIPYVVLIGNHDCLGTGKHVYKKIFGEANFSFIAGNVNFICLNTNALEYDYSHPVPDFAFIENKRISSTPNHEKTVVAMHVPPYSVEFNNNVAIGFQERIKLFPDLQFCLHAHVHNFFERDIFNDDVIYYSPASIEKRNYLLFTITPESYTYEIIYF